MIHGNSFCTHTEHSERITSNKQTSLCKKRERNKEQCEEKEQFYCALSILSTWTTIMLRTLSENSFLFFFRQHIYGMFTFLLITAISIACWVDFFFFSPFFCCVSNEYTIIRQIMRQAREEEKNVQHKIYCFIAFFTNSTRVESEEVHAWKTFVCYAIFFKWI